MFCRRRRILMYTHVKGILWDRASTRNAPGKLMQLRSNLPCKPSCLLISSMKKASATHLKLHLSLISDVASGISSWKAEAEIAASIFDILHFHNGNYKEDFLLLPQVAFKLFPCQLAAPKLRCTYLVGTLHCRSRRSSKMPSQA